jgi:hypothetical protein
MVSLLIPFGNSSPLSVEVDGKPIEHRVDQVGQDRFVTFHTDFHNHTADIRFE